MAQVEILGRKLGGSVARIGPLRNPNFSWLLLDRALLHYRSVVRRAHARRDELVLRGDDGKQGFVATLGMKRQKELSRLFSRLDHGAEALEDHEYRASLVDALSGLLERAEHHDDAPGGQEGRSRAARP